MSSLERLPLVLVDLGLGNLASVHKAVVHAAHAAGVAAPVLSADADVIARAERVIVPGQGAFRDGAAALDAHGGAMRAALGELIARGAPYFGICLGLQLLFTESEEAPGARGLGHFAGRVVRIPADLVDEREPERHLKVPHMGWNVPHLIEGPAGARLRRLDALSHARHFYFVHSYHACADDPQVVGALASYGCLEITAAVAKDNVVATQFHPEKSQRAGLDLLAAVLEEAAA